MVLLSILDSILQLISIRLVVASRMAFHDILIQDFLCNIMTLKYDTSSLDYGQSHNLQVFFRIWENDNILMVNIVTIDFSGTLVWIKSIPMRNEGHVNIITQEVPPFIVTNMIV